MSNNQTVTNDNTYLNFKKDVTENGYIRKEVMLAEIEVGQKQSNGNVEYFITYRGSTIPMDKLAINQLIKLLGLGISALDSIATNIGDKAAENLMNIMRKALQAKEGRNMVTLLVDHRSKRIVNILRESKSILSNGAFFSLFEDVMTNNPSMKIKQIGYTDGGSISISVVNSKWEFNIGNLKEEFFHSGLTFINSPTGTTIVPFNERLSCTNGMVVAEKGSAITLANSSAEHINGFFARVREIKDMKYFEVEFKKRVVKMMNTVASFDELYKSHKTLTNFFDTEDFHTRAKIEEFMGTDYIIKEYLKARVDLIQADVKFKQNCRTDKTVWDLVNAMTDLSSHADFYYLQFKHTDNKNNSIFQIQKEAGSLCFKDPYDLSYTGVVNPFDSPITPEAKTLLIGGIEE